MFTNDTSPHLRILFFLLASNFDRVFGSFLESLLQRGHHVHVLVEKHKPDRTPVGGGALLDSLVERYPAFSYEQEPELEDRWLPLRTKLRSAIDFLRYFEAEFQDAPALYRRARERAPSWIRLLEPLLTRIPSLRRLVALALARLERTVPIGRRTRAFLAEANADVVLVSPLVGFGARQSDWVRVATDIGIPTVLPVASWDNLTNKGVVKQVPTKTIVWNHAQAAEAIELHAIPSGRVVVSGAHAFDHWFDRRPQVSSEAFQELIGLPPGPYFLYTCSSSFIAGDETPFFRRWHGQLRASDDAALRHVGVLVRPHPQNAESWQDYESDDQRVVVWPRGGASPTDPGKRDDYFHSLSFAVGVVGINTSALIEAAIVRRPSFTLLAEVFRETQSGVPHFAHVANGADSLLVVGRTWEEHLGHLSEALAGKRDDSVRIERFLRTFIRPNGLDQPAATLAAQAVEEAARERAARLTAGRASGGLDGTMSR